LQLNGSHEQYKLKQVADDNAFSNLTRSLSPSTQIGNVTSSSTASNSTGIINLAPGSRNSSSNNTVVSSATGIGIGSISTHHRASVNQPHHHGSVSSSHSTNSTQ
jgi:hypothetical protein